MDKAEYVIFLFLHDWRVRVLPPADNSAVNIVIGYKCLDGCVILLCTFIQEHLFVFSCVPCQHTTKFHHPGA